MIKRRIFNKKKFLNFNKIIILILFLTLLAIIFYNSNIHNKLIIISENKENFYIIPEDRGGEIILNLDKKILNINSNKKNKNNLNNPDNLLYSIQFYTSSDIEKITLYLNKLTDSDEIIYKTQDFFILTLNSEIGTEYFLLYKNFKSRDDAKKYCIDFVIKIEKCIIVDTNKF